MTMGLWPYLDVDVVLALDDDLDVGVMDGLLVVLDASRPIGCRTQHLLHTERGRNVTGAIQRRPGPQLTFRARAAYESCLCMETQLCSILMTMDVKKKNERDCGPSNTG